MRHCIRAISLFFLVAAFVSGIEGKPSNEKTGGIKRGAVGPRDEAAARQYLIDLEPRYSQECNKQMEARWAYVTNVNNETAQASLEATNVFLQFQADVQKHIFENRADFDAIEEPDLMREIKYLRMQGPNDMDAEKVKEMNDIMGAMETTYATATVCEYVDETKCDLKLDPDIEDKISDSTAGYEELAHYFTKWHDAMGVGVTPATYKQFIDLQNEMARANGFNDMSEMWIAPYEDGEDGWTAAKFKAEMLQIWEDLKPLYSKLHAYVRMKLRKLYPEKTDRVNGYIPANLLGNVWAQDWSALDSRTKPYPDEPSLDATAAMIEAGYTVRKMFNLSEEFFTGLNLDESTNDFWEKTMYERPPDVEVVCHASAEDFCLGENNTDFRIKMCTSVNMADLITVHHEMGHIQYFQQYTNQRFIFRNGANPGFHEAIGDALALAVTTPFHLQCVLDLKLNLTINCENPESSAEPTPTDINFLYLMALQKFAFFPFAIAMDSWRWKVFDGTLDEADYNDEWWNLRRSMQGIDPPSERPNNYFDPAAKYHIVANVPYIRYFVSHILQFQFYEAMCVAAGKYNPADPNTAPLYQCDFAGNHTAGEKLKNMMQLGFSKAWPDALQEITGNRTMSVDSLNAYFKPLFDYIDKELEFAKEPDCFGTDPLCIEQHAASYLETDYETESSKRCNEAAIAEWNFNTDLDNSTKEELATNTSIEYAQFQFKEWQETINRFNFEGFADQSVVRQLTVLKKIGVPALPDQQLREYNRVLSEMAKIYSTSKVCPYTKQDCNLEEDGINLDPELETILSNSTNYDELSYVWRVWREVTGRNSSMKELYESYVELGNEAAKANGEDNMGDFWLLKYESDDFRTDMFNVWKDVEPLYRKLFFYVRHRLRLVYDQIRNNPNDPIPANVLGNMWAQTWDNIYTHVVPYPNDTIFDVTPKLKEKFKEGQEGAEEMFVIANEFFTSLGLSDMSVSYGEKAMIVRPGRNVVCHASAWDFCDKNDFRIKMCTKIDQQDFVTIHHELGHIQYDMNYKDLPITFRDGANPGFHEAIGDVIALSVETPEHMVKIELMDPTEVSPESTINYLMKIALSKVAFLPFGYLIDAYRWGIFDGTITADSYTYHWLKMRSDIQGVIPPVKRSEEDFDPGAKYHVPGSTPYIRYFVSNILQFQIHKKLCEVAGHDLNNGLHTCDVYNNTAAGTEFKKILEAGYSQNWQDLLQSVTGSRTLDATAIKDYFKPLEEFLDAQLEAEQYSTEVRANAFHDLYDGIIPTTVDPNPPTTTEEDGSNPTTTADPDPTTKAAGDDNETETAAIIVGIILGVAVLIVVLGYFLKKKFIKTS